MDHSPGFLKLVEEARQRIKEVSLEQAREILARNSNAVLMDVREDNEWNNGHAAEAIHLEGHPGRSSRNVSGSDP